MPGATAEVAFEDAADAAAVGVGEKSRLKRALELRELGILSAAIALFIALSIARPDTFFTQDNFFRVAQQISLLTIIAVGMTFLFVAGELDLSVGSMYGLLALTISKMLFDYGWSPVVAMPAVILVGIAIGFVNGFLTTMFRIPSFIVTLGMLAVLRGTMLVWVKVPPIGRTGWFDRVMSAEVLGRIPAQIFWMLGVVMISAWVLAKTRFGYHVYATGSNEQAAANAGIDTRRVKIICFMLLGALTGLASAILIGWLHGVSRNHGQGYELDVIAAVIIGGTNLFGGIGSVFGTLLGAAIIGMVSNGLILLGVNQDAEQIVKGAVIILAVLLDVLIRRRQRI